MILGYILLIEKITFHAKVLREKETQETQEVS